VRGKIFAVIVEVVVVMIDGVVYHDLAAPVAVSAGLQ
jgi:hypothetical protein